MNKVEELRYANAVRFLKECRAMEIPFVDCIKLLASAIDILKDETK